MVLDRVPPAYDPIAVAIAAARQSGYTIAVAVGVDGDAAAILGITGRGRRLRQPGRRRRALYFSLGADAGAIIGVSVGLAVMVIDGPATRMAGDGYALEG